MIASQKIGKSVMGALSYNLRKMNHPDVSQRAILLDTNFSSMDKRQISREVELIRALRQVLKEIERNYNLIPVTQTKNTQLRAATKDELEMVLRTRHPSTKMLLQEVLSDTLKQRRWRLPNFIRQCEEKGIQLLFNQQSTGRISGITYYHDGIKITGQKLGDKFKWAELIK